jgi:hypothetical protein
MRLSEGRLRPTKLCDWFRGSCVRVDLGSRTVSKTHGETKFSEKTFCLLHNCKLSAIIIC